MVMLVLSSRRRACIREALDCPALLLTKRTQCPLVSQGHGQCLARLQWLRLYSGQNNRSTRVLSHGVRETSQVFLTNLQAVRSTRLDLEKAQYC